MVFIINQFSGLVVECPPQDWDVVGLVPNYMVPVPSVFGSQYLGIDLMGKGGVRASNAKKQIDEHSRANDD